ncbi:hypothetical protein BJX99DRAFT_234402 [Aspergillus californicus]
MPWPSRAVFLPVRLISLVGKGDSHTFDAIRVSPDFELVYKYPDFDVFAVRSCGVVMRMIVSHPGVLLDVNPFEEDAIVDDCSLNRYLDADGPCLTIYTQGQIEYEIVPPFPRVIG